MEKEELRVVVEKEPQSAEKDEVLSVELPAPPAWKKLVSLFLSLSLSLVLIFNFENLCVKYFGLLNICLL